MDVNVCVLSMYIIHTCVFKCIYMLVHMTTIVYVYKLSTILEACSK